jgi:hypothetical protein
MADASGGPGGHGHSTLENIELRDRSWDFPDPFALYKLGSEDGWDQLAARYVRQPVGFDSALSLLQADGLVEPVLTDRPFLRCLAIARQNSARTAIVETRYIDADYRSEYSLFYSKAFTHYEDSAHRIHFFQAEIDEDSAWRLPPAPGYIGYVIVRPNVRGLVGRTMLQAPLRMRNHVRTAVRETVDFFGQALDVRAVPFIQQDTRLDACAQAAGWMCHYSAYRRADRGVHRRTIGEFTASADRSLAAGRLIPSTGLSLEQLSEVLTSFGLPPVVEDIDSLDTSDLLPELRPSRRSVISPRLDSDQERASAAIRLCCRYLNSGIPVLAILRQWGTDDDRSDRHAVVVCGYSRDESNDQEVRLIVNDDSRGPYLTVNDILKDADEATSQERRWDQLMVPLPEKLWMTGSGAERRGLAYFLGAARRAASAEVLNANKVLEAEKSGNLGVRTYFSTSNRFKERLRRRCRDEIIIREYALVRLPRFVWVVEALDLVELEKGKQASLNFRENRCVLGEVVFDGTSDDFDPTVLAIRIPGLIWVRRARSTSEGGLPGEIFCSADLIASGGMYDP